MFWKNVFKLDVGVVVVSCHLWTTCQKTSITITSLDISSQMELLSEFLVFSFVQFSVKMGTRRGNQILKVVEVVCMLNTGKLGKKKYGGLKALNEYPAS